MGTPIRDGMGICICCGQELTGQKRTYCSDPCACRVQWRRKNHRPVSDAAFDAGELVRCAANDCRAVFRRYRPNHLYCSTRCQARVNYRRYVARQSCKAVKAA